MNHCIIFNVNTFKLGRASGSYRIATVLRNQGWDTEVIEWATQWTLDELKELAKLRITKKTVFCGFSTFFQYWDNHTNDFITWLKKTYPHIKIIVGGSRIPVEINPQVDYYITGYAEQAILLLIKKLVGVDTTPILFDPAYLGQAKVISANTFYPATPMRDAEIIYEDRDFIKSSEWLTTEFSRGCKFKCDFCSYPFIGIKGDTTRNVDNFLYQMRNTYDRFGVTNYHVTDETFNDSTDKIIKFADAVEQLDFQPWFSGFIRPDLLVARPTDWLHLSRMGFLGQYYGVESTNHKTAKNIGKGMPTDQLLQGILDAKKYFQTNGRQQYRATISLIAGLPYETVESLQSSIAWLIKNWQGQGIDFYPLLIEPTEKFAGSSEISKNWQQYGYRVCTETDLKISQLLESDFFYQRSMNWENDQMNFSTAYAISNTFAKQSINDYNFAPGVFDLDRLCLLMPLEDALSVSKKEFTNIITNNNFRQDFIKEYIDKKLSL